MNRIDPTGHFIDRGKVTFQFAADERIADIIREYRTSQMRLFETEARSVARMVRDIRAAQGLRQ